MRRGEHQFAVFAIRHRLQGLGVDDLGEEVVLGQVQAAHLLALEGHAGPMTSDRPYTSQYCTPSFSAISSRMPCLQGSAPKMPGANLQIGCRVDTHLDGGIGDMQGVGRRACQHVDLHILEHLDLALGVTRGNRDDGATGCLAAAYGHPGRR